MSDKEKSGNKPGIDKDDQTQQSRRRFVRNTLVAGGLLSAGAAGMSVAQAQGTEPPNAVPAGGVAGLVGLGAAIGAAGLAAAAAKKKSSKSEDDSES